jgi:hypothetical protein
VGRAKSQWVKVVTFFYFNKKRIFEEHKPIPGKEANHHFNPVMSNI